MLSLAVLAISGGSIMFGYGSPVAIRTIGGFAQPFFYGMELSFDRFAAIFVFLSAATALLSWPKRTPRERSQTALLALATSLLAASGNIVGIVFFLMLAVLLGWGSWQSVRDAGVGRVTLMFLAPFLLSAGYFVLSGGALFSSLQTIGMMNAGLDAKFSILALVLGVLGFLAWMYGAVVRRAAHEHAPLASSVLMFLAGFYVMLRMSVFLLPVIPALAGVLLALVAVGMLACAVRRVATRDDAFLDVLAATATFLLALALFSIATEAWQLMNLVMFGLIGFVSVQTIALLAHERLLATFRVWERVGAHAGLARVAPWFSLSAVGLTLGSAAVSGVVVWMTMHGVLALLSGPTANWQVMVIASLAGLWAVGVVAAGKWWIVRSLTPFLGKQTSADVKGDPEMTDVWPVYAGATAAIAAAFFAPSILVRMGADALARQADSINSSLVTGVGSFAPLMVLGVLVVGGFIAASLLRGASDHGTTHAWQDLDADETPSRILAYVRRLAIQGRGWLAAKGRAVVGSYENASGRVGSITQRVPFARVDKYIEPLLALATVAVIIMLAL